MRLKLTQSLNTSLDLLGSHFSTRRTTPLELGVRWYTVVYIPDVYIEVPTPRELRNQVV
jgi:hypothetical protein